MFSLTKIKRVCLFSCIILIISFQNVNGQTLLGGIISSDSILNIENSPYLINEDLLIEENTTLIIEPGVLVYVDGMIRISVRGTLLSVGESDAPIEITLNPQLDGDIFWKGLYFTNSKTHFDEQGEYTSGNNIANTKIEKAVNGIVLQDESTILIDSCLLQLCKIQAIFFNDTDSSIVSNSIIRDNSFFGINVNSISSTNDNRFINLSFVNNEISAVEWIIRNSEVRRNIISKCQFVNNGQGIRISSEKNYYFQDNQIISNFFVSNTDVAVEFSGIHNFCWNNVFFDNKAALRIDGGANNLIHRNLFIENQVFGLQLVNRCENNTIHYNQFSKNNTGIQLSSYTQTLEPGENDIKNNSFIESEEFGFRMDAGDIKEVNGNNFFGKGVFKKVGNFTNKNIMANNNYWSVFDFDSIHEYIHDYRDNPKLGRVFVMPFEDEPIEDSHIFAPFEVTKMYTDTGIYVQWEPPVDGNVEGLKMYYDFQSDWTFLNELFFSNEYSYFIENGMFSDKIALTSYNSSADGMNDISEGNESWYNFARALPFAGNDTTICHNSLVYLSSAISIDSDSILWTTLGDGYFKKPKFLHTPYLPGEEDIANGSVDLILNQYTNGYYDVDTIHVTILEKPFLYLGEDHDAFKDSLYVFDEISYLGIDSIQVSGGHGEHFKLQNGHFAYRPDATDFNQENIWIKFFGYSGCGDIEDSVSLFIQPSYIVEGSVNVDQFPLQKGKLILFQNKNLKSIPVKGCDLSSSGKFRFNNVEKGLYYLYAIPEKSSFPEFIPGYYVNALQWNSAYKLLVDADTYDLDLNLDKLPHDFIKGIGEISGSFTISDKDSYEYDFFQKNWFDESNLESAHNLQNAQNLTVILQSVDSISLGWTLTDEQGKFLFDRLPFGKYRIIGEKAGYPLLSSTVFEITPDNPIIENINISLNTKSITVDHDFFSNEQSFVVYPNPCDDILTISSNAFSSNFNYVELMNVNNVTKSWSFESTNFRELSIENIPKGVYVLKIYTIFNTVRCIKIVKL